LSAESKRAEEIFRSQQEMGGPKNKTLGQPPIDSLTHKEGTDGEPKETNGRLIKNRFAGDRAVVVKKQA